MSSENVAAFGAGALGAIARKKALHNHPAYSKLAFLIGCGIQTRGSESHVEDHRGKRFLALFDQYGNQTFGYSNPYIVEALQKKLATSNINSTKVLFEEDQIALTERLSQLTNGKLKYAYLANSGGETIDNAIKLARATTRRSGIISAQGCFHGKTFGALSAAGRPDHLEAFGPFLSGFESVPFGDIASLGAAISQETAAVILEPVQAENGIRVPPDGYLKAVRQLCDSVGALLIFDEMQTAFGRTGSFFAFQTFDVVPDLLCIGKAFGGGILPISAVIGTEKTWGLLSENPTTFGSSLGGNPLSCVAGMAAIDIAAAPGFTEQVRVKADIITKRLSQLHQKYPALIKEIRGIGMMHGLELRDESLVGLSLSLLYDSGVISTYCLYDNGVLRVQPPLTISHEDLDGGLNKLEAVLAVVDQYAKTTPSATATRERMVEVHLEVSKSLEDVEATFRRYPLALDPFALRNDTPAAQIDRDHFDGFAGTESLQWVNEIEFTANKIWSRCSSSWLWKKLVRVHGFKALSDTRTQITVRVEWDAGTFAYEQFLAAKIDFYVRERLKTLSASLPDIFALPHEQVAQLAE